MSIDINSRETNPATETEGIDGPMLAAFEVGRALRRWWFFAVQQWLGIAKAQPHCEAAFTDLARLVRSLVPVADRDRVGQSLRDGWQNCQLHLESAGQGVLLDETNSSLAEEWRNHDYFASLAHGAIERLLGPLEDLTATLRSEIVSHLDDAGIGALSLGEWLEQGPCPSDVGYHLSSDCLRAPCPVNDAEATRHLSAWLEGTPLPASRTPDFVMAARFLRPGEISSPPDWLNGVAQRWEELRTALGRTLGGLDLPIDARNSAAIESTVAIVEATLRQDFLTAQRASPHDGRPSPDESVPGYLGLMLDESLFSVRQVRQDESVSFAGKKLLWEILKLLVRRRGRYTLEKDLRPLWPLYGRVDDPEDRSIGNDVSEVRQLLRPLCVGIRRTRGTGWRLESIEVADTTQDSIVR